MASNNKRKTSASQQRGTEKSREAKRQAAAKKRKQNIYYGIVSAVLIIAVIVLWCAIPKANEGSASKDQITIGDHYVEGEKYFADIVIKKYGTITVELDATVAPITVENFVNLAASGFYDGLTFHRIISGFMMQGGDPKANGLGGASTQIYGEFTSNGWENNLKHTRGVISMARSKDPNSASSQFFIMHKAYPSLDGNYASFGWVIDGIEIVDEICASVTPLDYNGTIGSNEQPVIKTIKIYTAD